MNRVRLVIFLMFLLLSLKGLAEIIPQVQVAALNFMSPDYANTHAQTFMFTGISLLTKNSEKNQPSIFNIDIRSSYAIGNPVLNFINIREIYLLQSLENFSISYGRKKYLWSGLDEVWNLGFFQPQFRWNSIDPKAQGQTGIFLESTESNNQSIGISWMAFGSFVFLPDQGPGFELKEGQFQATNPWFTPPAQEIEFDGQVLPIDYNVVTPKNEDVVFQAVYGAQMMLFSDAGFYSRLSYLSTPSHQMAINYKAALVADRVRVDLVPKFYREQNAAVDIGYQQKNFDISLFFLSNQPEDVVVEDNYNFAKIEASTAWGPHFNLQGDLWGQLWGVYGNGIFTQNGEVSEQGPDASSLRRPLTTKYLFKSAYQLGLKLKSRWTQRLTYQGNLEWTEATPNALKFLKLKNHIRVNQAWSFFLDFLLVDTDSSVSAVSHLQNLDQVWGGVNYEF